jgi:hypothetical protein
MSTDFIPAADKQFLVWLKNLIAYLLQKYEAWNIPSTEITEFDALIVAFDDALSIAENPATRTKVAVQAKNDARKAVKRKARALLKAFVTFNSAVTNADRDAMGLPIYKTGRTPAPVILTVPFAEVMLPSPAVVEIHFRDSEKLKRAKPAGAHGVEIAWAVRDDPPEDWSELVHSSFDTRTPYRLTFDGFQRGKTLYFALRWENTRGEKGPWSEIYNTIIP